MKKLSIILFTLFLLTPLAASSFPYPLISSHNAEVLKLSPALLDQKGFCSLPFTYKKDYSSVGFDFGTNGYGVKSEVSFLEGPNYIDFDLYLLFANSLSFEVNKDLNLSLALNGSLNRSILIDNLTTQEKDNLLRRPINIVKAPADIEYNLLFSAALKYKESIKTFVSLDKDFDISFALSYQFMLLDSLISLEAGVIENNNLSAAISVDLFKKIIILASYRNNHFNYGLEYYCTSLRLLCGFVNNNELLLSLAISYN